MARPPLAASGTLPVSDVPPRWYTHEWNRPVVYRAGARLLGALPRRARLGLARAVAAAAPFPAERAAVRANLARVVPGASTREREALVRAVLGHFAMCFADLLSTNRTDRRLARRLATVEGGEHLDRAAADGRGVILMPAHLGNWELAGRLLAQHGGTPTWVVVAEEPDADVDRFLRGGPAPVRFVTLGRPTAGVSLLGALRRRELVALQGDRALGTRGDVGVPFFGAPAPFPIGPFVLARAAGAPLVPAFCVLDPDRRYRITLGAPIRVAAGGERRALAAWVAVLEAAVCRHPEQWFNFYDVWHGPPAR